MNECTSRILKHGTEFWLRVPADFAPLDREFAVRVQLPEKPHTVLVPTMLTRVRRFGRDRGLVVPGVLVRSGVLRHRQDVRVVLLAQAARS